MTSSNKDRRLVPKYLYVSPRSSTARTFLQDGEHCLFVKGPDFYLITPATSSYTGILRPE